MAEHEDGWHQRDGAPVRWDYWTGGTVHAVVAPQDASPAGVPLPATRWGILEPSNWVEPAPYSYGSLEAAQHAAERMLGWGAEQNRP